MTVIVDLDGTLCDCSQRIHYIKSKPKNWKAFYAGVPNDSVLEKMHDLVFALAHVGHRIILCTGREEIHRETTEAWLESNVWFDYEKLYMRSLKDYRPDSVVKIELLEQMRKDGYDPDMAIDDRQQVVDAFREAGLLVLQCAKGDF
ncbi:MAG: HAD family acid phosphatase [Legionella sp.]|uniref:phosphatase domain-containing protein n=1 Tax=Legionella sp. TaxID=459 RepID=UPI00283DD7A4|nr:HAD family acid phosphatase [Legionella sp.]